MWQDRKRFCGVLVLAFLVFFAVMYGQAAARQLVAQTGEGQRVIVVLVKGEIDEGKAALVKKAVADVPGAQALVLEIDTFGGQVDAAVKIRDMITSLPVPTICYIKNRAWSAGALIALAHQHLAIAPGGSIGAAEPIPATEKTIAALRAEFAATANKTGRNPQIAEAMVDKSLGFPGYTEPGKILALTDYQAIKLGYADLIAANREDVLAAYGLQEAVTIEYAEGWSEKLANMLADPTVKSLLISVIFLALFAEIKTAGMGAAGAIGAVAAVLFFGSQWLTGVAGWLEIVLFIAGIGLMIAELAVPGVGIFGLAGIISILASFFLTLGADVKAINVLAISLLVAAAVFLLLLKYLPSSRLWANLVLQDAETTVAGFTSSLNYSEYLGQEGVTKSQLRPAGIAMIAGRQLDVVAEGQYIMPGTAIKVINVDGNRIVVRELRSLEKNNIKIEEDGR